MSQSSLFAFCLASVLLALSPGPDNLYVLAQSVRQGWRAGLLITLGLCTGLMGHTLIAVSGMGLLLSQNPTAMKSLQLFGAGYLIYLAMRLLMGAQHPVAMPGALLEVARRQAAPTNDRTGAFSDVDSAAGRKLYLRGVVMNLSNPKVTLFFLAFLPQFADPMQDHYPLQLAALGLVFALCAFGVFLGISLMAHRLAQTLSVRVGLMVGLNRLLAGVLLVMGVAAVFDGLSVEA